MSYHSQTDDYLRTHEGPPSCPSCGREMFAEDDHGRFACVCNFGAGVARIPQVDTTGLSDGEKAKIPPMHRLHDTPTAAEAEFLQNIMKRLKT